MLEKIKRERAGYFLPSSMHAHAIREPHTYWLTDLRGLIQVSIPRHVSGCVLPDERDCVTSFIVISETIGNTCDVVIRVNIKCSLH